MYLYISSVADHIQSAILVFMNNVASLAIEQCLLSSVAKMLSSVTVRDMEDEELRAIAAESDETIQERARLSDRVKTLEKALGILRLHPGKYETVPSLRSPDTVVRTSRLMAFSNTASRMQNAKLKSATLVGEGSSLSAETQATQRDSSSTTTVRPAESILDTKH